ncbi:MAG TPA: tetratricopeptide repeat protein [Planctomycetota bacterium]
MHRLLLATTLSSFLAAAAARAQTPPGEADFEAGLAAVHAQMQKARWNDARTALVALVGQHEKRIYVQAQCEAIVSDLRTCAFYAIAKVPKLAECITGKVTFYDEATGRLKVTYSDKLTDWQGAEESQLLVNPIVFAGSYTVTISGKRYPGPDKSLRVLFDLDPSGDSWFLADFGSTGDAGGYFQSGVMQGKGDEEPHWVADARLRGTPLAPFKAVVRVGDGQVEMVLDNKSVVKTKREKVEFGHVGLMRSSCTSCDEIVLEGKVEPSFLQGRVDEALAAQREQFDKSFDAKKQLPAWLFERPDVPRIAARDDSWIPGLTSGVSRAANEMLELCQKGKYAEAAKALAQLRDGDMAAISRQFMKAWIAVRFGRGEHAEPICAELLAKDAEMTQARLLRGQALEGMGRVAEAIAEYEAAVKQDPGCEHAHDQLCVALLRRNRTDDARRVVREAKTKHGLWDEMAQLETMLAMAARGPNWPRRFVNRTTHYEVVSDIDQKMCAEACRVLEASYVNLMAQLTWIKEDKSQPRFRVFLFSGESGYQDYVKAIVGEAAPHTAGIYSPVLKQLLIWNVTRREDMVRTIRHEGFHQFLDRIMENPPTWLNEGMAEFWETAKHEQGKLVGGQLRREHVATLTRSRNSLPKLKDFVYGGRGDFYEFAQQRYAQGWALVHFLRKGPRENTARFEKLWNELRTAKGAHAALDVAFAGVDWDEFERQFWLHLTSLK